MEKKDNQSFISRRGMLKSFGLAGAAIATAPILGAGESALKAAMRSPQAPSAPMKVGLLLPSSSNYSTSFLNGYNLYLDQLVAGGGTLPFATVIENIGAGPSSAMSKLNKLITEQNITVGVGLMNSRVTKFLSGAVEAADINFIEANLGENFYDKVMHSDRFFQSSLNLWQAHYMLGEYAALNVGNKAICATSFTDSGYDALYAFEAGFTAAGGTMENRIVSGSPVDNLSPVDAAGLCSGSDANVVFANYSGSDAAVFLSAFRNLGVAKPIYSSGMMIQQRVLNFTGADAEGVVSAHTWDFGSATNFDAAYNNKYNAQADDFSVLGYDTASILCSAASQMTRGLNPLSFNDAMSGMEFTSPRGVVKMNAATHAFEAPISVMNLVNNGTNLVSHVIQTGAIDTAVTDGGFKLTPAATSGAMMAYPD